MFGGTVPLFTFHVKHTQAALQGRTRILGPPQEEKSKAKDDCQNASRDCSGRMAHQSRTQGRSEGNLVELEGSFGWGDDEKAGIGPRAHRAMKHGKDKWEGEGGGGEEKKATGGSSRGTSFVLGGVT